MASSTRAKFPLPRGRSIRYLPTRSKDFFAMLPQPPLTASFSVWFARVISRRWGKFGAEISVSDSTRDETPSLRYRVGSTGYARARARSVTARTGPLRDERCGRYGARVTRTFSRLCGVYTRLRDLDRGQAVFFVSRPRSRFYCLGPRRFVRHSLAATSFIGSDRVIAPRFFRSRERLGLTYVVVQ